MKTNLSLLRWILPACLLLLTPGCAPGSGSKGRKEAAIEKIDRIKAEKQLGLVEYEVSKIVKAKDRSGFFKLKQKSILCACKAYLKAGVDLSGFNPMTDIVVDADETMITLTLPKPVLLSLNMPIGEVDVLYEKTKHSKGFNVTDLNELLRQGEDQIRQSVPELGILEDAEQNARLFFEPLLKHLGFTTVVVLFKEDEPKA